MIDNLKPLLYGGKQSFVRFGAFCSRRDAVFHAKKVGVAAERFATFPAESFAQLQEDFLLDLRSLLKKFTRGIGSHCALRVEWERIRRGGTRGKCFHFYSA